MIKVEPKSNYKRIDAKASPSIGLCTNSDFTDNYIHTGSPPISHVENSVNPLEGYPKLQKLRQLKSKQVADHATRPFGCRRKPDQIIPTVEKWIVENKLQFDVIMIGALADNQFIYPFLSQLPLHKLCSKPGFLFIWASTQKIRELTKLLNSEYWGKKFRRSEELVFVPLKKNSAYYPKTEFHHDDSSVPLFERQQWHCWMCITGTVRRSSDYHLIHCNIDTDLQMESITPERESNHENNAIPENLYRVVENFSNSNRRLHIIPSYLGINMPVRLRPGWVILSPDCIMDNFNPDKYQSELLRKSTIKSRSSSNGSPHYLVPQTDEIDELRPKSPPPSGNRRRND
ncbi:karyogamy protein Kar4p [[Candida] railenensis]|uniref:Karyogamy protein Kar4p n=1 Tax=[Candida] railenensis TaxID=45579 RepID=A0A9P0W0A2_9ASCO|nr:karyogamy protein Kar4p [[Candida] railenensis]